LVARKTKHLDFQGFSSAGEFFGLLRTFGTGRAFQYQVEELVRVLPTIGHTSDDFTVPFQTLVHVTTSLNMNHRTSLISLLTGTLLLLGLIEPVSASTLSLDTGKSLELQPGETKYFTTSFTNSGAAIENTYLGWIMGLQFIPEAGASGTLTIGEVTQPAVDPMPAGTIAKLNPTLETLANSAVINGLTTYYNTSISATDALQTVAANSQYNFASFAFTASPDAAGTWTVYAVQQQGNALRTYWLNDGIDTEYTNLPYTSGGNNSLALGTISVVPEPNSLVLASSALVAAAWCGWRRRSRQKLNG